MTTSKLSTKLPINQVLKYVMPCWRTETRAWSNEDESEIVLDSIMNNKPELANN